MTDLPQGGVQSSDPPALPADGIDDLLFGLDADDLNDFDGLDDFGDGLVPNLSSRELSLSSQGTLVCRS